MKRKALSIVLLIGILAGSVSTSLGRRRENKPPSSFGRNVEQYQQSQYSPGFGQQTSGFGNDDYDDGGIQQVNRDTEDFSGLIQKPSRNQPPPKYTQQPEESSENSNLIRHTTSPEAVTPKGTFHGLKKTVNGKDVYVFFGVPYAKPPTGNLRFRRPEPADTLTEPYEATKLPNACPQTVPETFNDFPGETMWAPNTNISEDCLYLNIWVPATVFEKKESELVPVLFWIYGGGYFSGSNSLDVYNGAVLAVSQDLVVVSVQYRLGPFGFLYFGTEDAPGNMGLLDQSLGLRWTRNNIEYFGGDPNSITIAGESCGAASVGFHLVSPLSKTYFKRAIMTSGLPTANYALKSSDVIKSRSFQLAKYANCNQKDFKDIVECLKKVDSDKLTALQWKLYKNLLDFPFSPIVDGYFLLDHPDNVVKKGSAKRTELMLGTVRDEGTYFILYHYMNYFSHLKPTSVPYDRFVDIMNELFYNYSETEREAIIDQYTNWENPEDGYVNQKELGEAIGDAWFVCPHRKFADEWSNRGLSVYYYHFTERLTSNPWAKWMGVMHGDDIPLFFGAPVSDKSHTDKEREMSQKFMEMVGNFARVGVPSNKWERYTSENPVYLDVNATTISTSSTPNLQGPRAKECAFWNKMLPVISRSEVECINQQRQGGFPQQQQFGRISQPEQFPQWNPNGQGIHGGQGFHFDNLQQPSPMPMQQPFCAPYVPQTPMYLPPPPQYPSQTQNYGMNSCTGSSFPAVPKPTESCRCTIQEGSTSGDQGQQVATEEPFVTPKPARVY